MKFRNDDPSPTYVLASGTVKCRRGFVHKHASLHINRYETMNGIVRDIFCNAKVNPEVFKLDNAGDRSEMDVKIVVISQTKVTKRKR